MSYDRQTVNILVLELATMVVAVAVAFGANLLTTFDLSDILYFIFATSVAIWFWWGYVMDRLEFPPKSNRFPLIDVVVLIFIALIPFALRQRHVSVIAGTLAAVVLAWAFLMQRIVRENTGSVSEERIRRLRLEIFERITVGLLLVVSGLVGVANSPFGFFMLYFSGIVAIVWTVLANRRQRTEGLES